MLSIVCKSEHELVGVDEVLCKRVNALAEAPQDTLKKGRQQTGSYYRVN